MPTALTSFFVLFCSFVNLIQDRVFWEKSSQLRKCHYQISSWINLWYVFLIDDCCGRDQLIIGDATPGLRVL